jgi:hypothetical protein
MVGPGQLEAASELPIYVSASAWAKLSRPLSDSIPEIILEGLASDKPNIIYSLELLFSSNFWILHLLYPS